MIKVMTLNINYYGTDHGPWSVRRRLIQEILQDERPDIIALQAVRQDPAVEGGIDQAAQLANLLPEYPVKIFQPAETGQGGVSNGLGLVARLPIDRWNFLPLTLLPGLDDNNQRILLQARFLLPGGPFDLFNAHFSWVTEQIQKNLDETFPYLNKSSDYAMLVGDLNATPDSEAMRRMREQGWYDTWASLHPSDPGFTFVENDRLSKRIDYVWVKDRLKDRIYDIRIIADEQAGGFRPSNHAGLFVTLDL